MMAGILSEKKRPKLYLQLTKAGPAYTFLILNLSIADGWH